MEHFNTENITIKQVNIENTGKPKIVVIGVGGGGSNMTSYASKLDKSGDIKYVVTNTDLQHLNEIDDPQINKIQLGKNLCRGLG